MSHETPTLEATRRQQLGTRYARRLRRDGQVPAVVYGHQQDPVHIAVNAEQFSHCLHEGAHLLEIKSEDGSETCLIKDVQFDYLGSTIIHVDLARIDLNEEVTVTVPIVIKGRDKAPGAKAANAIIEQPIVDLEVACLASNIPDEIIVDISGLQLGEVVTVADLKLPEGVRAEQHAEDVVISIHEVREVEEVEEEVAVAEGEPALIGERKEDQETEEGEAKAKG